MATQKGREDDPGDEWIAEFLRIGPPSSALPILLDSTEDVQSAADDEPVRRRDDDQEQVEDLRQ